MFSSTQLTKEVIFCDGTAGCGSGVLPIGPEVCFEVREYDFARLVGELVEIEQTEGLSSIEMFARYVSGTAWSEDYEDWLSLFMLYLGTNEVKRFL